MSWLASQKAPGFFKRFRRGCALASIPLYDNLTKTANILEDIEGYGGIKIIKPFGGDGYGWKIVLENEIGSTDDKGVWSCFYSDGTLILRNCYVWKSGVLIGSAADQSVSLSSGDTFIGFEYDMETSGLTAISGGNLTDVCEVGVPDAGQETFKKALYKVRLTAEDVFSVLIDFRNTPDMVGWI